MTKFNINEQELLNDFLFNFYSIKKYNYWTKIHCIEFFYQNLNNNNSFCTYISQNDLINNDKLEINLSYVLNYFIKHKIFIANLNLILDDLKYLNLFNEYFNQIPKNIYNQFGQININIYINNFDLLNIKKYLNIYKEQLKNNNIFIKLIIQIENPFILTSKDLIFLNDQQYNIQPIISSNNIINMNNNIDYYLQIIQQYPNIHILNFNIIKDNTWTNLHIQQYKQFLLYAWQNFYRNIQNNNFNECLILKNDIFDIYKINWMINENKCNLQKNIYINLFDLSFPICNSLITSQFIGGYLNKENNEIIPENNLSSYLQIKTLSPNFYPQCINCLYKHVCQKGCLGEQFKNSGEILLPIENICILEQTRIDTLLSLYINSGILNYLIENNLIENKFLEEWFILIQKNKSFND